MEVALAAQQAPGGKRKRGQHAAQVEPRIQVNHNLPFAARPFCWTHGPCQHAGNICKGPPPLDARQQAALATPGREQVDGAFQEQRAVLGLAMRKWDGREP